MKIYNNPPQNTWNEIITRPTASLAHLSASVQTIFDEVRLKGDHALLKYTALFDGVSLTQMCSESLNLVDLERSLPAELVEAIALAKQNIETYHRSQIRESVKIETTTGVYCWQEARPIEKVGLYIPGGSAPLFSTVLMLAIPAKIAGCKEIVLCSPPQKDGKVHPAILYAAALCGVTSVFTVGGIQAIAAMTLGTESIPQVYKIFGPGNSYVTAAKQYALQLGVAIDMPAGPSELLVVADETSNPDFVAADLLSQAEHGTDSQVVLVANSEKVINEVNDSIAKQINELPRVEICRKSMQNAFAVVFENIQTQCDFINTYAPEHYSIQTQNVEVYLNNTINAGSVFIGPWSPESAGDYASGTNHTLPTAGFAKSYSGVQLDSFCKYISFQKLTQQGLKNIGKEVQIMAQAEALQAHANAVIVRLNTLKDA
jgi:histidinol dehydrogenase